MKLISTNKKVFHDYFVVETLECGINLIGCEVKSLRKGEVNLADSYCRVENGNLVLLGCHIKNYDKGSFSNTDSRRDRRLLAHKREVMRLLGKVREKGYSIVPLKMYFKDALVKVEVGLVKGKQNYDKKQTLLNKDLERDKQRAIKEFSER
ncbi:MAG: SsrA-binding protein SmpB [Corallococcus sp.]|nr:SsrA-binding protein SmpB [Corallococcus sp.]MCM1359758.1 SsrA-binding protein SmpB [Corallococcus sp.]MCM1395716.1 SsrA-binding protein SmpB [Corallococcus sp.]